jgi:hypothetical protein
MRFFAAVLAAIVSAESMYNPLKSEVAIYNHQNFPKQVTNNREKGISIVQFYKAGGKQPKQNSFSFSLTTHIFLRCYGEERSGLV